MVHPGQIEKGSPLLEQTVTLAVQSVGSDETDTLFDSFNPGYPYYVKAVEHFAEALAATASYDIQIAKSGGNVDVVAAEVPSADTREDATIDGADADRRGADDEPLELRVDTDGTGSFTGLKVKVTIRPEPAGGEPGGWKAPPGGTGG